MKLDFFYAKQKHKMWKVRLRAYLLDLDEFDKNKIADHHSCDLGKWIDNYAREKYGHFSFWTELESNHEELHKMVFDIISYKENNEIEKGKEILSQLENLSDKIVGFIDEIEKNQKN